MSIIRKGKLIKSNLSKNANGGTEMMAKRLIDNVDSTLLEKVDIHVSRLNREYLINENRPQIAWFHDLADDPAVSSLHADKDKYDRFIFVSHWQRDDFIRKFNIPYSKCSVIPNAIEKTFVPCEKPMDRINFIYHTTPHRGLELVYHIFDKLSTMHSNIHLDVYSSFSVYGWEQRDKPYKPLFEMIDGHKNMTYHGGKSNDEVIKALETSHVFLYPSIWRETSCIALIEAMNCCVFPIYPSYGALVETGSFASNIGMYPFSENMNENASNAFSIANRVIENINNNPRYVEQVMAASLTNSRIHTIDSFAKSWECAIVPTLRKVNENQ